MTTKQELEEHVEGKEYELRFYFTERNNEIDDIHTLRFTLNPFDVVQIESRDFGVMDISEQEVQRAVKSIKAWLFKEQPRPFRGHATAWECVPEFDDKAMEFIQRLYVMDEL